MTILQRIMEELNIREVHEIPTALTKALLDSNTCSVLLKAIKPYYSYEALLAEFEEHSADRKKLYARLHATMRARYNRRYYPWR